MVKRLFILSVVVALGAGCAIRNQKNAIRDARFGVAVAGVGLKAADNAATEYFENYPADDTEKYCQGEIALRVLETIRLSLLAGENGIKLWETAIAIYASKKAAHEESDTDWTVLLDAQSQWRILLADIVSEFNFLRTFLELAGVKLPEPVAYAWNFLNGMAGGTVEEATIDWGSLGVCEQYLKGGE